MRQSLATRRDLSRDAVLEALGRLHNTKQSSITLLEKWQAKTADFEIKSGIKAQLTDERRHLRLLGEEIKRLGGRLEVSRDQFLSRPFAMVLAQPSEAFRLSAFYRGVKAFTSVRCGHLIPMVDRQLAMVLEQISREEERHIRWADIRLSRFTDLQQTRQCRLLVEKVEAAMDMVWTRPWRKIAESKLAQGWFFRR